jgi:hypothetical protein
VPCRYLSTTFFYYAAFSTNDVTANWYSVTQRYSTSSPADKIDPT